MSYLVLARKYRPKTFDDVAGQPAVAQTLKNAIRLDRIAHAYLFSGPRGVGKTSLARILARCLCCEKGPTPEPCGACARCVSILKGSDIDVVEIDAASNRGIDDVRDLRERARIAPMLGRYKLYVVDEAHQLTNEAFNALLKILEEPPAHVLFVLATTEAENIPETIRSRCQCFEFRRVAESEISARLEAICAAENVVADRAALEALARAARGGMRDAQSLLDQAITHGAGTVTLAGALAVVGALSRQTVNDLIEAIFRGDGARVAAEVDRLDADGVAAENVVDALLDEAKERLHRAALAQGAADLDRLIAFTNLLLEARRRVREHDDPRLVLELSLLRLARLGDSTSISEALEWLREGGGAPPATASATGAAPIDAATAFDRLVREIESTSAPLGGFLRGFRAGELKGDVLEIAPSRPGPLLYDLTDTRVRAAVGAAATKVLGRVVQLRVIEAAPDAPGTIRGADPKIVERAIELFDGQKIE